MCIRCGRRGMCWEVIVEVWPPGCYVDVVDSCVDCVMHTLDNILTGIKYYTNTCMLLW